MNYEIYSNLYIKDDYCIFEFSSTGPNGIIPKRIVFAPMQYESVYNLIYGDIDEGNGINDYSISNNCDRDKILATIVHVIEIYLRRYPERWVYFTGSTDERTRLYRMAIGINWKELKPKFNIFAHVKDQILPFRRNMNLDGFLIGIKP